MSWTRTHLVRVHRPYTEFTSERKLQGATCARLVKSGETTYVYKNAIQVRDFWAANLGKKSDTNVGQDGILPYFLGNDI